jgi:ATP-binding cassette, subfamily B, bacterial
VTSRTPAAARTLMRQCLRAARAQLVRSFLWATVRQAAFLALPWLLGRALDHGVKGGSPAATAGYAGAFAAVAVVEYAGMRGWQQYATLADAHTAAWLRTRMLRAVLSLGTEELRSAAGGEGELNTRATRDAETVVVWVHGLTTWVVIGVTGLVLVPAIGGLDPLLLLVAALTVPVLLAVNRYFPPVYARRAERLATAHARRGAVVEQLLGALLPLRGVGADRLVVERHHERSAEVTRGTLRLASVGSLWEATGLVVPLLAVVAGLLAAGPAVAGGHLTVGALTTFVLWMGTVSLAVGMTVVRLGDRAEAKVAAGRIAEILAAAPEPRESAALPRAGVLRVSGLTVRRPGRAPLGPLELTAGPGEWIALTGATGSGKSTLLRAVAGLVPAAGEVEFGGVRLAGAAPEELYRAVGLVPEGPLLVNGTVRENLLLGGGRDGDELSAAALAAGLDVALGPLDTVWERPAGERGGALSGGQRQSVALARTLLRDCPVLLLDDVTSALDTGTEAEILARLRRATAGRAVVFATHSPAVRALADREVRLPGGGTDRPAGGASEDEPAGGSGDGGGHGRDPRGADDGSGGTADAETAAVRPGDGER